MKRQYSPLLTMTTGRCTYCGAPAADRDHYRAWANHRSPYWVPSCSRCNRWLGSKEFDTLGGRAGYIYSRVSKTARKLHKGLEAAEDAEGNLREMLLAEADRCRVLSEEADWALEVATETHDFLLVTLHEDAQNIRDLENLLQVLHEEIPL